MSRPRLSETPRPLVAVAGLAAILAAIPVLYIGVRLVEAGWDGVLDVLTRPRLPRLLVNTVTLALTVTLASGVLGVLSAFVLTRVEIPARRLLSILSVLPLAIPSYLAAFGWLAAVPGAHGFWPAWLVLTVVTTPYVTLPVSAALRGTPASFPEVARTLGYGPVRTFRLAIWPTIRTAALSGTLLVCLYTLSDFGGVALFRYQVLTTAIQQAYGASFDRNYAAVLAAILVVVAVLVFAGERRLRPRSGFGVGRPRERLRIGRVTPVAVALLLVVPVSAVGVPLVGLFSRLLNAQTVRELDVSRLLESIGNTILLAAAGALVAVVLAVPIAMLAARFPGRAARLVETAGSLPLALPGIVVGLGLAFFSLFAVPALYQTATVLAFAYGVLFLPKAIGTIRGAIERVPRGLEDVAGTLGYGQVARWWHVTARMARPGIVVAALFVAVTAMKELPATLMLRPTGTSTLAVELWARTDVAAYGAAVPYAIALVLLAAVPAVLLSPRDERFTEGIQQ